MPDFAASPVELTNLALLKRLSLLEKLPEKTFSRITSLAAQLFKAPFTLVSLADGERSYIKAFQGFTIEQAEAALAWWADPAGSSEITVVPDTWQDARFQRQPLVTQAPYIRFF